MSLLRLKARVNSATFIGMCMLKKHDLRFHKKGRDNSSKCDCFETGQESNFILGALFEIDQSAKAALDVAEGLGNGYELKTVQVIHEALGQFEAITYYATDIDASLKPYDWYVNHVLIGAKEINVPEDYLAKIETSPQCEDPDKVRDAKERAVYN